MNRRFIMYALIGLFLCGGISAVHSAEPEPHAGKVIVMGFMSPLLNSVQERYLRESVMRSLIVRGVDVVSASEYEKAPGSPALSAGGSVDSVSVLKKARACGAAWAVYGRIYPVEGPADEIARGGKYLVMLTAVNVGSGKTDNFKFRVNCTSDWYGFFHEAAEKAASHAASVCTD